VSSGLAAKRSVAEALAVQRLDALERRLLLSRASGLSREDMARRPELLLDEEVTTEFDRLITEREAGQPIAYLLGEREFYGRSYKVDHRVLIPRPESELLVDIALQSIGRGPAKVLDIGTGSGCLAITLKLERPDWEVGALDISGDAINVAKSAFVRLTSRSPTRLNRHWLACRLAHLIWSSLILPMSLKVIHIWHKATCVSSRSKHSLMALMACV
jgi:release factor glutamine methyltransferase